MDVHFILCIPQEQTDIVNNLQAQFFLKKICNTLAEGTPQSNPRGVSNPQGAGGPHVFAPWLFRRRRFFCC